MILQVDLGQYAVLLRETALIAAIQIIYVLSLNLEAGYLGLPQFGKVMFLALGALAAGGIATKIALLAYSHAVQAKIGINPLANINSYCSAYQYVAIGEINKIFAASPLEGVAFFLLAVVLAAAIGGIFGILMAGPALRLREDYLGILLLVSAETIRVVTTYTPQLACGVFGAVLPDPFVWMGDVRPWGYLAVAMLFALVVFFVVERLGNSPFGRALKAIRDAETAAVVFG
ncbi:MAG: branched-chain amino acid ABC transporter permease, partial [Pyrobaculum sp.]